MTKINNNELMTPDNFWKSIVLIDPDQEYINTVKKLNSLDEKLQQMSVLTKIKNEDNYEKMYQLVKEIQGILSLISFRNRIISDEDLARYHD